MSAAVQYRPATEIDLPAIGELNSRVFGPGRFARSAYRLRENGTEMGPHCWVAMSGVRCVGAVTITPVMTDAAQGVLVGPVAIDAEWLRQGIGSKLITKAVDAALADETNRFAVLVGDLEFYSRFGFIAAPFGQLQLPGPVDPARLLVKQVAGAPALEGIVRPQP